MLREHRRLVVPELDAESSAIDVRTPFLRVCLVEGRHGATDWGVVERATPFVHRLSRTALTLVLTGRARFDEGGRHLEVGPGQLALSDQTRGGTEAYAGDQTRVLVVEWDPRVLGARHDRAVAIHRLDRTALARLEALARALGGADADGSARIASSILDVLRAHGLDLERFVPNDLVTPALTRERRLVEVLGAQLSQLHRHPDLEDVGSALGWNARLVHRRLARLAECFGMPGPNWMSTLRHYRFTSALRLLSAPGATTELVARATGFRSPSALCHAFDDVGLPSPGTFARDARGDVLGGWLAHVARPIALRAAI